MNKYFLIILSFILFGCQSPDKSENNNNSISTVIAKIDRNKVDTVISLKANTIDTLELKKIWNDCMFPIMNLDKEKLKQIVYFPLAGDWGYMVGLNKSEELWTEKEFYYNLQKLFHPKYIDKLKKQTFKDISVYQQNDGEINLLVAVNFETKVGNIKTESSTILRFRKIINKWKLYVIFHAG